MKRLSCLFIAAAFLICSCKQKENVSIPDSVTVISNEVTVGQSGVSQMPVCFSASADWTLSVDKTFVSFDQTEGKAGEGIIVMMSVEANDTYADREARVMITSGEASTSFVVKQGFDTEFDVLVSYRLPFEPSDFTFTVNTNADYKVVLPANVDWVREVSSKAAPQSKDILFHVDANNEEAIREAMISIEAGKNRYGVMISQENQAFLSDPEVTYLGRRMAIYDMDDSAYNEFNQYYVTFKVGAKTVAISLNSAYDPDYGIYTFPTGAFSADLSGKHLAQTFTVAGIDSDMYTTVMDENGSELDIVDGTIEIRENSGSYTIIVSLETAEGKKLNYKYSGELPDDIVDDSFGGQFYSGSYNADYDTYFSNHNKAWEVDLITSRPVDYDNPYARFISLKLYADATVPATLNSLPAGSYSFDAPESASNGYVDAKPFSFSGSVSNSDNTYTICGGSIIVSDADNGKKTFSFNISMAAHALDEDGSWVYDEDWNYVYDDPVSFKASFAVSLDCTEGLKPTPDGDAVLTNSTMSSQYVGLFFGNPDTSVDGLGVMTVNPTFLGGVYNMYLSLGMKDWSYELNFNGKYCNTPIPDGVYEFSQSWKTNSLLPLVFSGSSQYCYVQNTYTGTSFLVCGGSVEIKDGKAAFNMRGISYPEKDAVYSFTGSIDFALYYARDYARYSNSISLMQFE